MATSQALTLTRGPLRLALRSDLGGCIAGLWFDGLPVLRSSEPEALESVRLSGSYPLVPYSNRIGYGQFEWMGQAYRPPGNFAPEPHAIHGVAWQRGWTVVHQTADGVRLSYQHPGDAAWPFAFHAEQDLRLEDHALSMELRLTNRASAPVPAGLGWHPYFVKRARSHIAFGAQGRWEMGPDKLPTERRRHDGLDCACDVLDVDHCFDGWAGETQLHDEALRLRIHSSLRHQVVFTHPTRDFVAIEPVSHVNNALQLMQRADLGPASLGLRILQAGESTRATMRIAVEKQA